MKPKEQNTQINSKLLLESRLVFLESVLYPITSMLVLLIFFNFSQNSVQRYQLAIAELMMLIVTIAIIVKAKQIFSSRFANIFNFGYTAFMILAWIATVIIQPIEEMIFVWYFVILIFTYAVNGVKVGVIVTSILSVITILVYYFKSVAIGLNISSYIWLNTLFPSFAVWIMVHIYESNNNRFTQKVSDLAIYDTLTGLKDRHQVYNVYEQYSNQMNSLILLDIDGLCRVNEQQGYLAGDVVLINVANILEQAKISGQAFRIDGDEFAILLPNTDCKVATSIATALRDEITEYKTIFKYETVQVTVSLGIACIESDGYNFDELLKKSNFKLLQSKASPEGKICTSC